MLFRSGHVQFDPFDSPWKPLAAAVVANVAPTHAAPANENRPAAAPPRQNHDTISDLRAAVDCHEREIIEHHLARNRYNQRQTAKALGLSYDQLRHCMKKHGLMERAGG